MTMNWILVIYLQLLTNSSDNMITLRIAEILAERNISKTQFAEMMGVKKQNVNLLIETNNIQKLEQIAEVLGVDFSDLIVDDKQPQDELNGFVEYKGEIHRIKTKADLEKLLKIMI